MLSLIPVAQAASSILLSKPSYYRLAQEKLVPPPIRISGNRSAVIATELESVMAARIAGKADAEIRVLVESLIEARQA